MIYSLLQFDNCFQFIVRLLRDKVISKYDRIRESGIIHDIFGSPFEEDILYRMSPYIDSELLSFPVDDYFWIHLRSKYFFINYYERIGVLQTRCYWVHRGSRRLCRVPDVHIVGARSLPLEGHPVGCVCDFQNNSLWSEGGYRRHRIRLQITEGLLQRQNISLIYLGPLCRKTTTPSLHRWQSPLRSHIHIR